MSLVNSGFFNSRFRNHSHFLHKHMIGVWFLLFFFSLYLTNSVLILIIVLKYLISILVKLCLPRLQWPLIVELALSYTISFNFAFHCFKPLLDIPIAALGIKVAIIITLLERLQVLWLYLIYFTPGQAAFLARAARPLHL